MRVFEFTDFREFMRYCVSQRLYGPGGRKKSNLVRVSKELGYSSPSVLSMVLNGKRLPSDEMCDSLIRNWKLSLKEAEYFRTQVQIERKARSGEDVSDLKDRNRRLMGASAGHVFSEPELNRITEWHHIVVQQMVELPTFKEDPNWISQALRGKITPTQALHALRALEAGGILERDPQSQRLRPSARLSETTHDVPSSAIREHQKGMIKQALVAIEDRPVQERFFTTLTLAFDSKRLPEVRKNILEMMRALNDDFSSERPDSVYQLCLQFFEHTNTAKLLK